MGVFQEGSRVVQRWVNRQDKEFGQMQPLPSLASDT